MEPAKEKINPEYIGISALPGDIVNPWREVKKRVLSQGSYWQLDAEQGLPDHPTEMELKSDLTKAGFIDIQSEVKTHHLAWADAEVLMQWLEASTFDNFIPRGPKNIPEDELAEIEALRQVAREAMKGVFEKEYRVDKTDENDKRIAMDMKVLYAWGYKGRALFLSSWVNFALRGGHKYMINFPIPT